MSPRPTIWGGPAKARARARGFTLIELLVVITIVAIASAAISISLRDPAASQLEREAERLTGLLETARAESRAAGVEVQWLPLVGDASGDQFRFVGLPASVPMPRRWLGEAVAVEIVGARSLTLGPEPMIGPQQLVLSIGQQRVVLSTDGLSPFQASPVGSSS
ncbi:prepilin-type N-terminal cleavage/methylation domain-containing protein [Paucibacter sp. R3-3]|uniref:Prepilin-type N-terminal cleavage/methylation domain-containing protein n=1 Tax=Roseateles agri TaxID=3098619 RepID=A0ABU5DA55_9BURK|nr:prepilin-type N-terminal cleavage/methylation domain-containing protein [Paucibacter sp. R3-3]MDY0743113.1 prepilin-type N-terminal cleavage/methylation domain-containing protein [Paucibacter sp. R3-3]